MRSFFPKIRFFKEPPLASLFARIAAASKYSDIVIYQDYKIGDENAKKRKILHAEEISSTVLDFTDTLAFALLVKGRLTERIGPST